MAEGKGQRAKGRGQGAEGKGQRAKCIGYRAEGIGQKILTLCSTLFALCSMLLVDICFAASVQQNVKMANNLYRRGKLDEALQKYNDASVALPDSDIINFNMGAALYKKEDYQKAIDYFTKALTSEDRKLEADALYNLGNCKYRLGKLKENTDLSTTVALLRESLDYYKRAIDLDQKNTDARFNHEFIERELKILLDKLKQQQSAQDKQKEQQQQKEERQGACPVGKESIDSAQDKQGKEDKEKSAQGKEQEQQEKEGQEGQSQEEERQQKEEQAAAAEAQQEEQSKELSEQGARAILERYGQEDATPDYLDRRTGDYDREVLKDW